MGRDIILATTAEGRDIILATTAEEHDITNAVTGEVGEASAAPLVAVPTTDTTTEAEAETSRGEAPETAAWRPVSYASVPPDVWALARAVAVVLGETLPPPIRLITRIVDRLGPARARALLGQALTVEAQGGLTLPDGTRRTPGGVFFYLVRTDEAVSRADKASIFPRHGGRPVQAGGAGASAPSPPPLPPPATWTDDDDRAINQHLQDETERATTVKITVIGRPSTVLDRGQTIVLSLRQDTAPALPKGLPDPATGTRYALLITAKQWAKIAAALDADPEDALIAEGYPSLDPRFPQGITVHATSVTTKRAQAAKRAAQEAAP
jgi:hypothetical protein